MARPTKEEQKLLTTRKRLVEQLLTKYSKADIARIFNVHQAQINRILK